MGSGFRDFVFQNCHIWNETRLFAKVPEVAHTCNLSFLLQEVELDSVALWVMVTKPE